MRLRMRTCAISIVLLLCSACTADSESQESQDAAMPADAGLEGEVQVLEVYDVSAFNLTLVDSIPTVDLAFYITQEGPLEWSDLKTNIERAQRIFGEVGVQIRVSAAMHIAVPESWQRLDPDDVTEPLTPEFEKSDLYAHLGEQSTRLATRNRAVFEAIISYFPEQASGVPASNTIHVVTVDEMPIAFYEWDGSAWNYDTAPTGGLSFASYLYADRIPERIRGVITLSFEQDRLRPQTRTLSHEIGHKIINVSHEGVGQCPAFAAEGPELMLYGNGEDIPGGLMGRWHQERVLLSPFLYTLEDGTAHFANAYEDGGVYDDAIYGEYVMNPVCDSDPP